MEAKLDALTKKAEKHNRVLGRTYQLEQDMAVAVLSPIMAALGGDGDKPEIPRGEARGA